MPGNERHERPRSAGRAPVPDQEVNVLKALRLGALALIVICSTALASSSSARSTHPPAKPARTLVQRLQHEREALRFFRHHRWLLSDPRFAAEARRQIALHRANVARMISQLRKAHAASLRRKRLARRLAVARPETPQAVICRIFESYCGEALRVSRCESGFHTDAQNGQYLGLFQMGVSERRIFGHGATAEEQAKAAHRYFVTSGRDWSPWSCKPW